MPPSWSSFVDYERHTSDALGNFTFSGTILVTGNPAGATGPACSVPAIFSPFTGSCLITAQGTGSIGSGYTGLPDFVIQNESAVFHSHPSITVSNPFGSPNDISAKSAKGAAGK
jgi:hypothetical protein